MRSAYGYAAETSTMHDKSWFTSKRVPSSRGASTTVIGAEGEDRALGGGSDV